MPWKDHFFVVEKELHLKNDDIIYVIYKDNANSQWRVQAVPVSQRQPFENRFLSTFLNEWLSYCVWIS